MSRGGTGGSTVSLPGSASSWRRRRCGRSSRTPGSTRLRAGTAPVRAGNLVHGSDQQGCGPSRLTVMITGHVPAVRFSPDHVDRLMAGAVPAPGDVADCRDLDPAPPARRAAAAPAAPSGTELGGPGTARDPAQRDTQSAAAGPAAAGD